MRKLLLLAVICVTLVGCGGSHPTTTSTTGTTSTSPTTTTSASATEQITVSFFSDGGLATVREKIPQTPAVAASALGRLLAGPPSGYATAIPDGVRLNAVSIARGIATATFSSALGDPSRSAQAQIVATLTQFPTVHGVALVVAGRGPVDLQGSDGRNLGRPATSADYTDLTPAALIFVRTPAREATVSNPVHLAGTADTYEATFQIEIHAAGRLVATKTITATAGSGTRGTWSATLTLPPGEVTLVLYEASAKDGSHLHTTVVPLHVH